MAAARFLHHAVNLMGGGGDAFLIPGAARRVPGAPCLQHGLLLPTFLIRKLYSLINIIAVSGMLIVYGFGIIIG